MWKRRARTIVPCLAMLAILSGRPPGNSLAGAWQLNLDEGCNSSVDRHPGMVLNSDGSADLYLVAALTGVWSLDGPTITITILNPGAITFTGAVSNDGTTMTNGIYAGTQSGCWTGEKSSSDVYHLT